MSSHGIYIERLGRDESRSSDNECTGLMEEIIALIRQGFVTTG